MGDQPRIIHEMAKTILALEKRLSAIEAQARAERLAPIAIEPDHFTMKEICKSVAIENGLQLADVMGTSQRQRVARARQHAYVLCRKQGMTLTQIGQFFGRDHSSVWHGIRRAESRAAEK